MGGALVTLWLRLESVSLDEMRLDGELAVALRERRAGCAIVRALLKGLEESARRRYYYCAFCCYGTAPREQPCYSAISAGAPFLGGVVVVVEVVGVYYCSVGFVVTTHAADV